MRLLGCWAAPHQLHVQPGPTPTCSSPALGPAWLAAFLPGPVLDLSWCLCLSGSPRPLGSRCCLQTFPPLPAALGSSVTPHPTPLPKPKRQCWGYPGPHCRGTHSASGCPLGIADGGPKTQYWSILGVPFWSRSPETPVVEVIVSELQEVGAPRTWAKRAGSHWENRPWEV